MTYPAGWAGFWDHYATGAWEPETRAWLGALRPGDFFVDVGAWIGPVSLWALERGAYVFAIEPDPVAFGELERRVPDAWYGAVVTRSGTRRLLANPKPGGEYGDSMSRLGRDSGGGIRVPTHSLPGLLRHRPAPRLVKIDVEGYEVTLMRSLGPWLASKGAGVCVSLHGAPLPAGCLDAYDWVEHATEDMIMAGFS